MASHSPLSNPTLLEPEDLKLPGNDDLLIQVTSQAVFAQAHIEGAVLVELPAMLRRGAAVGKLPDLSALQQTLSNIGYHPERRLLPMTMRAAAGPEIIVDNGCHWSR